MEHNEPPHPPRSEAGGAEPDQAPRAARDPEPHEAPRAAGDAPDEAPREPSHEALRRLEERLDRASDAAERLIAEAAAESAARAAGRPPNSGWQEDDSADTANSELLAQVIRSLRELIPPELQRRLAEALRELLLALRALIDWYLERAERRRAAPVEVQDIPIV